MRKNTKTTLYQAEQKIGKRHCVFKISFSGNLSSMKYYNIPIYNVSMIAAPTKKMARAFDKSFFENRSTGSNIEPLIWTKNQFANILRNNIIPKNSLLYVSASNSQRARVYRDLFKKIRHLADDYEFMPGDILCETEFFKSSTDKFSFFALHGSRKPNLFPVYNNEYIIKIEHETNSNSYIFTTTKDNIYSHLINRIDIEKCISQSEKYKIPHIDKREFMHTEPIVWNLYEEFLRYTKMVPNWYKK